MAEGGFGELSGLSKGDDPNSHHLYAEVAEHQALSNNHLTPDSLHAELQREQANLDAYGITQDYIDSAGRQIDLIKPGDLTAIKNFAIALHNENKAHMNSALEHFKCDPQHLSDLTTVMDLSLNQLGLNSKYSWEYSFSDDSSVNKISIWTNPHTEDKEPLYSFSTVPSCER